MPPPPTTGAAGADSSAGSADGVGAAAAGRDSAAARAVTSAAEPPAPPEVPLEPSVAATPVRVLLEPPYLPGHPPRPPGRVLAAGVDEELARWNVGGNGDPAFVSNRENFHPGARVIVDTKLLSGKLPARSKRQLSEHGLLAHARKWGYWNFRLCFEDALRKDQGDGGKTRVRVRVERSGKVSQARLLDSELKDPAAADCLVEQTRQYRPFAPAPPQALSVELSIRLSPGDAPVPLLTRVEDEQDTPQLEPARAAALSAALESARERLEFCYRRGLQDDAALWGRVQLEIERRPAGRPARVRETESRFPDQRVSRCIRRAVRLVAFPPLTEGEPVSFVQGIRLGELPAHKP